jgi:ribose 5-phosphate isomerase B
MCISANKVKGIRAALCYDELSTRISRHHNDANVMCISGELLGEILLRKMVEVWLATDFAGGRHQRRVRKIQAIEQDTDPTSIKNNAD